MTDDEIEQLLQQLGQIARLALKATATQAPPATVILAPESGDPP